MKFGIHNPSWLFGSGEHEIFEAVKRKAQWAETHGFSWFSVMDHLIQIPNVGAADEPFMESWTVLSALAASTSKIRLATLVTSVAYRCIIRRMPITDSGAFRSLIPAHSDRLSRWHNSIRRERSDAG